MMKKTFLLALGALALAGNAGAQTVWQQIGAAQESQAYAAHRQASALEIQADALQSQVGAIQTQSNVAVRQEMREEAKEWAEAQKAAAEAKAEHEKKIQLAYKAQAERNRRRDEAFAEDARTNPAYHTDPIPQVANLYDDAATIRTYLHDSGYNDISDAQISNVCTYMHANGIRHVSQLGP
jgi:hypothetical protein